MGGVIRRLLSRYDVLCCCSVPWLTVLAGDPAEPGCSRATLVIPPGCHSLSSSSICAAECCFSLLSNLCPSRFLPDLGLAFFIDSYSVVRCRAPCCMYCVAMNTIFSISLRRGADGRTPISSIREYLITNEKAAPNLHVRIHAPTSHLKLSYVMTHLHISIARPD